MRLLFPLLTLILLYPEAVSSIGVGDINPDTENVDELMEQAEKLKGVTRCRACEEMVKGIQKAMKKLNKNASKQMKSVFAIDTIESACEDSDSRLYCDEAVEKIEDDLIKYIKKGKIGEDDHETLCDKICKWKADMKDSITNQHKNFMDEIKEKEVKRRVEQLRTEHAAKRSERDALPFYHRLYLDIYEEFEGYWTYIIIGYILIMLVTILLQACWIIVSHRRKLVALRAQKLAEMNKDK